MIYIRFCCNNDQIDDYVNSIKRTFVGPTELSTSIPTRPQLPGYIEPTGLFRTYYKENIVTNE